MLSWISTALKLLGFAASVWSWFTTWSTQRTGAKLQKAKDEDAVTHAATVRSDADNAVANTPSDDLRKRLLSDSPPGE